MQVESVQLIADGKAPRTPQPEEGASYEGIQKKSNAKVNVRQQSEIRHYIISGTCIGSGLPSGVYPDLQNDGLNIIPAQQLCMSRVVRLYNSLQETLIESIIYTTKPKLTPLYTCSSYSEQLLSVITLSLEISY